MGLFSFGGSKSSSSGKSQSSSYSNQDAASFDRAVSTSLSGGQSVAGSQQGSQSQQSIAFDDVFARLFGGAERAAGGLDASMLTRASNQLFSGGMQFLEGLGYDEGSDFLRERLSAGNPLLEQQIDFLGQDISEFLNEEINPAIRGSAIAAGQLGGGRQGVAEGEAAEAALEQFTRGAGDLRYQDLAARDAAAGMLSQNNIQGAATGLAGLQSVADAAELGFGAELEPFMRLAAILGDPTVLTQAQSAGSSFSTAEDFARALSESFGASVSTGRAASQSTSSTKSSSKGFNMGFGEAG